MGYESHRVDTRDFVLDKLMMQILHVRLVSEFPLAAVGGHEERTTSACRVHNRVMVALYRQPRKQRRGTRVRVVRTQRFSDVQWDECLEDLSHEVRHIHLGRESHHTANKTLAGLLRGVALEEL